MRENNLITLLQSRGPFSSAFQTIMEERSLQFKRNNFAWTWFKSDFNLG